jgi:hypothetical protein
MVYRYGSLYKRYEERHSYIRNRTWHDWAHNTIGTRYKSGLGGTFGNSTFSIDSGYISDEDITLLINTATSCTLLYRATGATYMAFENNISTPYKLNAGKMQYDNAGTLTDASNNNFVPMWVYGTNAAEDDYPVHIVVGQSQHSTIAGARNAALPAIPAMPTREWKLLYRAIYQQTSGGIVYAEAIDYREVSTGPGSTYTPAVHNNTTLRDAASAHPALSIDYTNTSSGLSATTVQAAIDEVAANTGVWETIADVAIDGTYDYVIRKTGLATTLPIGTLIRCYRGASIPSDPTDFTYALVREYSTDPDAVTLALGEAISGTGTLWVQKNLRNADLVIQNTPILGAWAAVTSTDAYDTYNGWRCSTEKPLSRFIGCGNVFSRTADTGAAQPTVNFTVGSTTFLGTDLTIPIEGSLVGYDLFFTNSTGRVTAGVDATFNTRIKLPVITTGTNKNSVDLQLSLVYVALD